MREPLVTRHVTWQVGNKKYTKAVTTNIEKIVFSRFRLYFSHLREYSTFILGT